MAETSPVQGAHETTLRQPPAVEAVTLTSPHAVQRSRERGAKLPPNTLSVTRPGRFGNPYRVVKDALGWWCMLDRTHGLVFSTPEAATDQAMMLFEERLEQDREFRGLAISKLRGHNLACFCKLPEPGQPDRCHRAVLLRVCNG